MSEKKPFATRIDKDLLKEVKHLSINTDRSIESLTDEAFRDLLIKLSKRSKK